MTFPYDAQADWEPGWWWDHHGHAHRIADVDCGTAL